MLNVYKFIINYNKKKQTLFEQCVKQCLKVNQY